MVDFLEVIVLDSRHSRGNPFTPGSQEVPAHIMWWRQLWELSLQGDHEAYADTLPEGVWRLSSGRQEDNAQSENTA